ncbi:MAG: J domain-containing protein [Desulfotignum sp.]
MYLAKISNHPQTTYRLRESVLENDISGFREICSLGPLPGAWIDYPGGNAWHVSPELVTRISKQAPHFDPDELEDLFWPFVRPDIRQATTHFRERGRTSTYRRMTREEKAAVSRSTHAFDKRRTHFLKFGNMDQGPLVNMPPALFRTLQGKCRDEIEQGFILQESRLNHRELKSYVYTIFDLQRFFTGFLAKKMPHVLDQTRVDTFFIQELCHLNKTLFNRSGQLHDHLIRYAVMFFDHPYGDTVLLEEMTQDFRFRSRFFPPPPKPAVSRSRAREIFNLTVTELAIMDKRALTRRFRKLAREHHPDRGGSHEKFVELSEAYQALLEKITRPV